MVTNEHKHESLFIISITGFVWFRIDLQAVITQVITECGVQQQIISEPLIVPIIPSSRLYGLEQWSQKKFAYIEGLDHQDHVPWSRFTVSPTTSNKMTVGGMHK